MAILQRQTNIWIDKYIKDKNIDRHTNAVLELR